MTHCDGLRQFVEEDRDDFASVCASNALIVAIRILHRPCAIRAIEQAANEVMAEDVREKGELLGLATMISTVALLNSRYELKSEGNTEEDDATT